MAISFLSVLRFIYVCFLHSSYICANLDKSPQTVENADCCKREHSWVSLISQIPSHTLIMIFIEYLSCVHFDVWDIRFFHLSPSFVFYLPVPTVQAGLRGLRSDWLDHLLPSSRASPLGEQVFVIICHP